MIENKTKHFLTAFSRLLFAGLVLAVATVGCGNDPFLDLIAPTVSSTAPVSGATNGALNGKVTAAFSEAMDPATFDETIFTLKQGETPVAGTVSYSGVGFTATFTPAAALTASTLYTATITTGAEDLAGNAIAVNKVWTFTTEAMADTTAPTVSSTAPVSGATNGALNGKVTAAFSEAMDPATFDETIFTLKQGETPVAGTVSYSGVGFTATFTPAAALTASTLYTATITTGAEDLAGNAIAVSKVWTFTTEAMADTTAPTVSSTAPVSGATNVALNSKVTAAFSEAMDPATFDEIIFTLKQGETPVAGTVSYSGVGFTATFTPAAALTASTLYTATITTGAEDLAGNAIAVSKVWTFTTEAMADTTAPTVSSTSPLDMATGVPLNAMVTATFSEPMDPSTFNATTVTVKEGAISVSGTLEYLGTTATFTPAVELTASTLYTAKVTTGVEDLAGNALAIDETWTFTTGSALANGPAPVILGTAGDFVILSKSGVDTVPTSAVTGDIGVSPIDSTAVTGFSLMLDASTEFATSPQVFGSVYAADYSPPTPTKMTTAISNMETAYTNAAGRTLPDFTELGAGDISGMTLVPGLYKWGTDLTIQTNVTLSGGANDVWIFQIAGDLTMAGAKTVVLSGGALPKNIFWQVAGGAGVIIGENSAFEGIVLAATKIDLGTGAVVNGRLLAQTAVNIQASTVTEPAP